MASKSETYIPKFGKEMRAKEFSHLRKSSIFLNHAAYGTIPTRIKQKHHEIIDSVADHPDDWFRRKILKLWIESRNKVADFVNCDPEDLVFVENVTSAVNTVVKSYPFKPGDAILATSQSYPACKNAFDQSVESKDGRVLVLKIGFPIHHEDDVVQAYDSFLSSHPEIKIAVLDHIASATVVMFPVKKIVEVCKKYEVLSLIDGAHCPGQLNLDLKDIGADFYTANMYKWCFTHQACAILHAKKEHQKWLQPLVTSHNYKKSMTEEFFMQGARDDAAVVLVRYGIDFIENVGGVNEIGKYCSDLLDRAIDLLASEWKTEKLPIPRSMEAPCVRLMRLPDIPGYTLNKDEMEQRRENAFDIFDFRLMNKLFHDYDIQVQTFALETGLYIRLSANIYNEMEDYEQLCRVIKELAGI